MLYVLTFWSKSHHRSGGSGRAALGPADGPMQCLLSEAGGTAASPASTTAVVNHAQWRDEQAVAGRLRSPVSFHVPSVLWTQRPCAGFRTKVPGTRRPQQAGQAVWGSVDPCYCGQVLCPQIDMEAHCTPVPVPGVHFYQLNSLIPRCTWTNRGVNLGS